MRKIPVAVQLLAVQSIVALLIGTLALVLLYRTALHDKRDNLLRQATEMAAIINAMGTIDLHFDDETPRMSALRLASNAFANLENIGSSAWIMIVERNAKGLSVLLRETREAAYGKYSDVYPVGGDWERALRPAFADEPGIVSLVDEHGHDILAAYAPIPALQLALVNVLHKNEFDAPYLSPIVMVVFFGLILASFGALITYDQTARIVVKAQENERRFKEFADTASDWYWEMDENLRFGSIGRGERPGDEFEYTKYVGMTRQQVTIEDTATEKWRAHQDDLDNRRPFKNFRYDLKVEGQRRAMSVSGFPVFDEDGKFRGYRGTGRDITDLIANRRRLEIAEARMRATFENITVGIIQIDPSGIVEHLNPMAERIFGYESHELIGKNVSMLMPEPHRGNHDSYLANYIETGEAKIIGIGREVDGLRKDGETFPLHLGVAEVNIDDERHFIGSITDLSVEKLLESQLRRSQKMDAIGQLTGGIAHDFNNLLGIIVGNLDLAQRKLTSEDGIHKNVTKAITAAKRGSDLTRRLLNFSRQAPEKSELLDINHTIRDIRELIQRSLTSDIQVDLMLSDDAWPVRVNKGDFEDVLVNFAINARDAMPTGGTLLIETRNQHVYASPYPSGGGQPMPPGDYVELAISDTGIGMSPEVMAHIFEPFFTTKEAGKGTGLGMSLIYGFVQRSEGDITVYSEQGIGTTFKVRLPRAFDDGAVKPAPEREIDPSSLPRARNHETVLIVDDEADLAEVAETLLRDLGYKTVVTHNGPEAMAVLDSDRKIDLLLTDVVMPGGMDGFDVAVAAQQRRPDIKIVVSSGFTAGATEKFRQNAHMRFPMLRKPYSNYELAIEVHRALNDELVES